MESDKDPDPDVDPSFFAPTSQGDHDGASNRRLEGAISRLRRNRRLGVVPKQATQTFTVPPRPFPNCASIHEPSRASSQPSSDATTEEQIPSTSSTSFYSFHSSSQTYSSSPCYSSCDQWAIGGTAAPPSVASASASASASAAKIHGGSERRERRSKTTLTTATAVNSRGATGTSPRRPLTSTKGSAGLRAGGVAETRRAQNHPPSHRTELPSSRGAHGRFAGAGSGASPNRPNKTDSSANASGRRTRAAIQFDGKPPASPAVVDNATATTKKKEEKMKPEVLPPLPANDPAATVLREYGGAVVGSAKFVPPTGAAVHRYGQYSQNSQKTRPGPNQGAAASQTPMDEKKTKSKTNSAAPELVMTTSPDSDSSRAHKISRIGASVGVGVNVGSGNRLHPEILPVNGPPTELIGTNQHFRSRANPGASEWDIRASEHGARIAAVSGSESSRFDAGIGTGDDPSESATAATRTDDEQESTSMAEVAARIEIGVATVEDDDDDDEEVEPDSSSAAFSAFVVPDGERRQERERETDTPTLPLPQIFENEPVYDAVAVDSTPASSAPQPTGESGATPDDDERPARFKLCPSKMSSPTRLRLGLVAAAALAVAVAIIVSSVLATELGRRDRSGLSGGGGGACCAPVPVATIAPINVIGKRPTNPPISERFYTLGLKLQSLMGADTDYFDVGADSSISAQRKALLWLADVDAVQLDPDNDDITRLAQRFALATLYYATGGDEGYWNDSLGFLSDVHECLWFEGEIGVVECLDDKVVDVTISNNTLNGTLPPEVGLLSDLTRLDLAGNGLVGPLPDQLGTQLRNLTVLLLDKNELTGTIPDSLGELVQLEAMGLQVNHFNGTIPSSLSKLVNVFALLLGFNDITGTVPLGLGNLDSLELLFLSSNLLSGDLSFLASGRLAKLQQISIGENGLTGSLPPSIFAMQNLTNINLNTNLLTGTLPTKFGNLVGLELLHVHNNYFNGSIPSSLLNLPRMDWLSIGLNELDGPLPLEIGQFSGRYLYLNANHFTGTIPSSLGQSIALEELYLQGNELNGTIPQSLVYLQSLNILTLHNNSFTGDLAFLCDDPPAGFISADCYQDDELSCSCCTSCCSDSLGLVVPDFLGCFQPVRRN